MTIEILRQCDPDLLAGCSIITIGGGQEIPAAVKLLRGAGLRTVGLSDGDMNDRGEGAVMSLPGKRAPEIEVFTDPAVAEHFANSPYKIALDEILAAVSDHHDYAAVIARKLMLEESYVATDACRAYASARDSQEFTGVLTFLRKEFGDRR